MKKVIVLAVLIIICSVFAAGCGGEPVTPPDPTPDRYHDDLPDESEIDEEAEPGIMTEFVMADLGDNVRIHTEEQAKYIADSVNSIKAYAKATADNSRCRKIELTWDADIDEKSDFKKYEVKVAEKKDLSDAYVYVCTKKKCDVINLKIGTTYYWRVYAIYQNQTYRSQIMSFTTENIAPRNLDIGGIENVRDIGGWKTSDGGTIRQGLIFRTSRLNENASKTSKFTGSGKKQMKALGIKTEIDLRAANMSLVDESPLGKDVKFVNIPMNIDTDVNILTTYPDEIRQVFEIFADESNYPIVFHCSGGVDRAGVIAFLLEGLLGLDEETLLRDYLFSNFSSVGSFRSGGTIEEYLNEINKAEGDSLSEKFFNYLKGIGLSEEQLYKIIWIMRTRPEA